MLADFQNYIEQQNLFLPGERILLAVSGGIDSSVMAELFRRSGFKYGIAHCNFMLRGQESERDEAFVSELASRSGVPLFIRHFKTRSYASSHKLSIQMAARELRYRWFEELMDQEGYDYVATAHNLDDQVETFLLNLARGTGIAGLHGILPKINRVVRPLMFASRRQIVDYALANQVAYVEDSSNTKLKYARNRIRHKVIPQFEKLNPSFKPELNETIHRIREAEAIYNDIIRKEKQRIVIPWEEGAKIPIAGLRKLDPGRTWLYEFLSDYNFNPAVVEDIFNALDDQPGKQFFSSTHRLVKDREYLIVVPLQSTRSDSTYQVYPSDGTVASPVRLKFEPKLKGQTPITPDPDVAYLDMDRLQLPLTIRKWRDGDVFYPLGMKGRKKLSDFFIDLKLPLPQKEATWLLCSGNQVAWVIGLRIDDRFKVTGKTQNIIRISLII